MKLTYVKALEKHCLFHIKEHSLDVKEEEIVKKKLIRFSFKRVVRPFIAI